MQGNQFCVRHIIGTSFDDFEIEDINDVAVFRAQTLTAFSKYSHQLKDAIGEQLLSIDCDITNGFAFQLASGSDLYASFTRPFANAGRLEGEGSAGKFVLDVDQVAKKYQAQTWKIIDRDYSRLAEIKLGEPGSSSYLVTIADGSSVPIIIGMTIALAQFNDYCFGV